MSKRLLAGQQKNLNARQIQALAKNSVSPDEILRPGALQELNEEIVKTYDQDVAGEFATKDKTLQDVKPFEFENLEDNVSQDEIDRESELERELMALREKKAKMQEEARAAAEKQEQQEEEEETREEKVKKEILKLLGKSEGAPSAQDIANWKAKYGKNAIQVTALGDDDVYVFTHLTRIQWEKIQEVVQAGAETNSLKTDPEKALKEKVLQHCVLWPRPLTVEFFYRSRAGVVDTLFEVIMMHSYFLTPAQALSLTTQL